MLYTSGFQPKKMSSSGWNFAFAGEKLAHFKVYKILISLLLIHCISNHVFVKKNLIVMSQCISDKMKHK